MVMAISIVVPQLGESVAEGTVARWLKAVGDKVRKEEPLVEIQTDKINVEIPSPADGVLSSILIAEGTTVLVGTEIAQLGGAGEATAVPVAPAAALAAPAPLPSFMRGATAGAAAGGGPREETIPFTRVRRVIAENMVKAKHTAAHTHCFDECDMGAIVALRKEWAPRLEAQGIKLTYMPFFIKAAVFALREFPWVNGSVSPSGDAMILKRYYNIGMAVGRREKGVIVPDMEGCDPQELVQAAHEGDELAARARQRQTGPRHLQGCTV